MNKGIWIKDGKKITGVYCYNWGSDTFSIKLDVICEYTNRKIELTTTNDNVGFNGWVLFKSPLGKWKYKR